MLFSVIPWFRAFLLYSLEDWSKNAFDSRDARDSEIVDRDIWWYWKTIRQGRASVVKRALLTKIQMRR